ncbi:MAG: alpha-1,2-fucosyltransferase [Lachnospiraceae bacterium]|jgi:hypothetical protein|nr:alpha-1,2-fucosyltransferase [Lachnospiraceae bacterium]
MFVVSIGCGLGNQMFQYAFYKELQYQYPCNRITVDICNFYGKKSDGYHLERVFGIKLPRCTNRKAMELADYHGGETMHPIINKYFALRTIMNGRKGTLITVDDPTEFYPEVFKLNTTRSYMFSGTWINENYFKDVKESLFEDFSFPSFNSSKNREIADRIRNSNSVSIHMRRGDYITLGITQVPEDYYKKGIQIMESKVGSDNIQYFIFSDDIEYAKMYFSNLKNAEYVSGNRKEDSYRDMQLMSLCKHNIIANSTFSYWGAFLNRNVEKVVIAPRIAAKAYHKPFACEGWILI